MSDNVDLSERQKHVISLLPASKHDIADEMQIKPNTVKGYIERIRDKGIGVEYDHDSGQYYLSDDSREVRRISSKQKSARTRTANEWRSEMERDVLRRLEGKEPLTQPPESKTSHESFCAAIGDTHFGDIEEDEHGNVVYDMKTAREYVEKFTENSLQMKNRMEGMVDFDDAYIFILGDIATGEAIYDGQVWDIETHLLNQLTESVEAFLYLIESYAEVFDTVQVAGVLGNHGRSAASASSQQSNTDLITYRWLHDRLIDRGHDNITFQIGEAKHYKNVNVRGWNFHLRHGHNTQKHVDDTAASSRDWRGWRDTHQFDAAIRGHHHVPAFDKVLNAYPVYTVPSPKAGGDFADKIGSPDASEARDLGWIFGTSDKRPVTFEYLIDEL